MHFPPIKSIADTAAVYRNESLVRDTLAVVCPANGVTPEDIFITSKLGNILVGSVLV